LFAVNLFLVSARTLTAICVVEGVVVVLLPAYAIPAHVSMLDLRSNINRMNTSAFSVYMNALDDGSVVLIAKKAPQCTESI